MTGRGIDGQVWLAVDASLADAKRWFLAAAGLLLDRRRVQRLTCGAAALAGQEGCVVTVEHGLWTTTADDPICVLVQTLAPERRSLEFELT